jgi:hypothetical protein
VLIPTIEVYSLQYRIAKDLSIPRSKMTIDVSESDDQGSITSTEVYIFPHPTTNQSSTPDDQISAYVHNCSKSHSSILTQYDFSSSANMCDGNEILS